MSVVAAAARLGGVLSAAQRERLHLYGRTLFNMPRRERKALANERWGLVPADGCTTGFRTRKITTKVPPSSRPSSIPQTHDRTTLQ